MGTITINLDDETEKRFRESVKKHYGTGKGILGKAVAESLDKWREEKEQSEIRKKALMLIKEGIDFEGYKFRREDAYEDRERRSMPNRH